MMELKSGKVMEEKLIIDYEKSIKLGQTYGMVW